MKIIYTDGSCSGNPGPGGFGVVVLELDGNTVNVINAHQETSNPTTNNREEMKSILWVLKNYGKEIEPPIVYSDSRYCVNGFTNWIKRWEANGWTRAGGRKLENLDLIKEYDKLLKEGYRIKLWHCRGHAGNIWNELADGLATGKITVSEVLENHGR